MNSGKIVADGWTGGRTDEGSIRGPRGPKNYVFPIYWREKLKFEGRNKKEIEAGPDVSEARGVLAWSKRRVAAGKRSLIN